MAKRIVFTETGEVRQPQIGEYADFDGNSCPRLCTSKPHWAYCIYTRTEETIPDPPKPISSVWTYTMSNTHGQRVAYPSQKPLAIVEPLIAVHTDPGDVCLDPFAGSGTLMEASLRMGRRSVAIDSNPEAIEVIRERVRTRFDGAVSLSIG